MWQQDPANAGGANFLCVGGPPYGAPHRYGPLSLNTQRDAQRGYNKGSVCERCKFVT